MTAKLVEAALGIASPWSVNSVEFDEGARLLTVLVDFEPGTHFAVSGHDGIHPVHDTSVIVDSGGACTSCLADSGTSSAQALAALPHLWGERASRLKRAAQIVKARPARALDQE